MCIWKSQGVNEELREGEEEALNYVAGWVCQKVKEDPELGQCSECERVLTKHNDAEHSYSTAMREGSFLRQKQYSSTAGLCNPSDVLGLAIKKSEVAIKRALPRVWGSRGITRALQDLLKHEGAFEQILEAHPTHGKKIERVASKKFIMCRVGAAIKRMNEDVGGGKRQKEKTARKLACLNTSPNVC